jgi:peptidoglycan/LPS O-acetylase OafA/YrhL
MSEAVERDLQKRASGKRIFALDAMRGLAAFAVVCYHFRQAFAVTVPRWYLRPIFAGHQAVILFFVLSGYVLSLPYWRGTQLPYFKYLVRRIFRIYVPYAAALAVAVVVAWHLLNAQLPLTPWFYKTWHAPITRGLLVRQAMMGGGAELNTAFWSLRYEMQMSIVFPLLCWLLLRFRPLGAALFGLALAAGGTWAGSASIIWAACFVFGAVLAWTQDWIGAWYARTPLLVKLLFLVSIAVGYFSDATWWITFGACGALIFAQHSRARRWLDTAIPEYLGRVSYSLYLIHGTVLHATLILLYGKLPTPILGAIFFVATMAAAHLFCIFIEEPANQLGRRLTGAKARVLPQAAPAPLPGIPQP